MLIFLRCLQATGGSSVVAVALGTVADIAAPSERAGFVAIASLGPLSAPAIGPIVGAFLVSSFRSTPMSSDVDILKRHKLWDGALSSGF